MKKSVAFLQKRENKILQLINKQGSVKVEEIASIFSISLSTARNQLNRMHDKNLIERFHGGAKKVEITADKSLNTLSISHIKEKEAIARTARELINDGDIIAIGAGTTTFLFASLLQDVNKLTVVTDSILIANSLMYNENIEVRICGGAIKTKTGAIIGPHAEIFFGNIYVDKSFVGVDSVSLNFGVTSADVYVSRSERGIVNCAKEVIILADYTKIGRTSSVDRLATFDEIDYIVTDSRADSKIISELHSMGVKVLVGEVEADD